MAAIGVGQAETIAGVSLAESGNTTDNIWQEFKGSLNRPEDKRIANAFGTIRNVKSAAVLGSAIISQQSDIGLSTAARSFNGLPDINLIKQYLAMFNPNLAEDRALAARLLLGLGEQRHYTPLQSGLFNREFAKPWSSRLVNTVMHLQGSARWAQVIRHQFGGDWWNVISHQRENAWADLDPGFRSAMQRGGFDADSWDQLRATPTEDLHGSPMIFPDNIADENLRLKTAAMILGQANTAVAIPDLRARAAMNSQVKRGTLAGELLSSAMMYKAFGVSIVMTQMQRMMAMPAASAVKYAARFAITMTLLGAMEIQMRHIAKGEDPEDMNPASNPGLWGWSLMSGGAGGIFSDYLRNAIQDPDKGIISGAAGPMAEDAQKMWQMAFQKSPDGHLMFNRNPRGAAFKIARGYVPGGSLWYARLAFDRVIADQAQQYADPNYAHSWATVQRFAQERGSPMYAPPGGPMRAPDFGRAIGQPAPPPP